MKQLLSPVVCVIALFGFSSVCKAQQVALSGSEFIEEVKPAATISGLLVLGAIRQSGTFSDHVMMTATLPEDWGGNEICISMISADGLYEARNTYHVDESWSGGIAEIPYPTKYADRLLELQQNELAISTKMGDCESSEKGAIMPIAWRSKEAASSAKISLYANGFGADEVFIYVGSDPNADPVDCTIIEAGVRTVFDTVCELDVSKFDRDEIIEIEMVRISEGQMSPSEFIELELGGSF